MFKGIYPDIRPGPILQWARRILRSVQLHVSADRVHNTSGASVARGTVVRYTGGTREIARANATAVGSSVATARAVGVLTQTVPNGGRGIMRTDDIAFVLLDAGLAPAAGDALWCSPTGLGTATTVNPFGVIGAWAVKLGTIADASIYAAEGACYALLEPCCEPIEQRQG